MDELKQAIKNLNHYRHICREDIENNKAMLEDYRTSYNYICNHGLKVLALLYKKI